MQVQEISADTSLEFIEDPEITQARLQKIKSALSGLAEDHMPVMAYIILLDAAINHLGRSQNKMFYFPIPWEKDTGLPSHPSLIADARHYCQTNGLSDTAGVIVNSFTEWQAFRKQNIFCCCGKGSAVSRERMVLIEIVIHHPIIIDRESNIFEIKQLVGIRATDRDHIENHYNLRRDSRVDNNISIIGTASSRIAVEDLKLYTSKEEYAEQFDVGAFKKIFAGLCRNTSARPT
ncbi:MAG: hypothetical protein HY506_01915 [Candidatus Yanofskybacteria bacterium]|nr:hypothetical protein [Candidatus Yanofskybacteria bacterium]